MSTESILKMFLFFAGLASLLASIVILGLPKPQRHKTATQRILQEAVRRYLVRKICIQFSLTESLLDKKALNRIEGAAFQSVEPLLKGQEIYVQLPQLIEKLGRSSDFELAITYDDVKPYVKHA